MFCFAVTQISFADAVSAPSLFPAVSPKYSIDEIVRDPSKLKVPFDYSHVEDFYTGSTDRLIIHIQDAHANFSGQKNLSETLRCLMREYPVSDVLVEGSSENVSLSGARESFSGNDLKKAADKLLFYGIISGEEHLNLTSSADMKLLGVEDDDLYQANLRSYKTVVENRESALAYIKQLKRAANHLKKSLYPEALLTYEQIPETEFMKKISDMQRLSEDAGLQLSAYSEIKKFTLLKTLESEIDFDELNRQLIYLMGAMNADLKDMPQSASQSEQLVWAVQLKESAEISGIETGGLEVLDQYLDYLREFIKLDFKKLTEEADAAEEKMYALLLSERDSGTLHSIDRYLDLLEKGYRIRMTSSDTETFNLSRKDFDTKSIVAFFNLKLAELGHFDSLVEFSPALDNSGSIIGYFYSLVNSRDKAFMRNILRAFEGDSAKVKFLISGGYHTRHISQLLRDSGISYITLSPKITDQTDHADYEKLLFAGLQTQVSGGEVVSAVRQAGAQTAGWERYLMLRQAGARLGEDSENLMRSIAGLDGMRIPDDQSGQVERIKILRNGTKDPGTVTPGSLVLTDEEINYLVGHIPGIAKAVLHIKFNISSIYFELEGRDEADYSFLNIEMLYSPNTDRVVLGAGEFKKQFVRLHLKGEYEDEESVVRRIEVEFWKRLQKILTDRKFSRLTGPSLPSRVEPYFAAMGFVKDASGEPYLYLPLADSAGSGNAGTIQPKQNKFDIRIPIEPYEGSYYPDQISLNIDRVVRAVLEVENRGNQPVNVLNIGSESNVIRSLSANVNPVNIDQREMPIPSKHAGVNFVMANLFSANFMEEIENSNLLRKDAENILLFHNMKSFFSLYGSMTSGMPMLGFEAGFWTDLYVRGIERIKPAAYLIFFEHDSPTSGFGLNLEETFLKQTEKYFENKNPASEFRIYDQQGRFAAYVVRLKSQSKSGLPAEGSRLSTDPERTERGQSLALGPDSFSYIMTRTLTNISGASIYQDNSSYDGVFYSRIFRIGDYSAEPISDLIRETVRTKGHAVVVDVGSGRQSALIQAKQIFGESIRTIAADVKNHLEGLDDNYYQSLGKRFGHTVKKEHLPEFVSGSMETVQLPERPDILLSVYSMPYVPDPLLGFENLYNQLAPGGIFAGTYFASQFKNFKPIGKSEEQEQDWLEMVIRELASEGLIDGKIGAGAFFIRKKTDQKIRVNLIRDESLRKLQRSSDGQVHGDYRIEDPGQPIVIIESEGQESPNTTIKKSKKKKKLNSGKPGTSKNIGARLAGDWKDAARRELESYGWAPQTVDRLFEEQHVEQLGRDAGFYLDPHIRVQSELLRKDFDSYIKRRIESGERKVRFAVFGIGKSPQEIADFLNMFYTTLESNGEVPADWKVYVDAFDKNDLYIEIANEDYFDSMNIDFMLSKIGLSKSEYRRGMFELKAHLADVSDFEFLSQVVSGAMKGEKADYTLFRNVTYTNREIESLYGDFIQMPEISQPNLSRNYRSVSNLLYHYHSVRNTLLAAAKNGGRYIIDPGLIYRHADDLYQGSGAGKLVIDDGNNVTMPEPEEEFSGRSFAFPGLRVMRFGELTGDTEAVRSNAFENSTGIYEVEDLGLITELESRNAALTTVTQMIADTKANTNHIEAPSPVSESDDSASASRLADDSAIRSNELNEFELLLRKHHVNTTARAIETSIRNGADAETAQLWFDALFPSKSFKFPERFFVHPTTLRNWVLATLDSLPGFKDARENGDWKEASAIYRKYVLAYPVAAGKKGSPQTHFFQNESGLFVSRMIRKDYMSYLRETERNSKNSMLKLVKFALPELLGSYPLLLESEVEKGTVDSRKFISEDLLKSAFEGGDENSIQSLIRDYGTPEKGIIVVPTNRKIRQYPRIHFFTNKSGKDIHLNHPEKVAEPLKIWFEKKQGKLFAVVYESASDTFLYRALYDQQSGKFVYGADYAIRWFESPSGYPLIEDPILVERQEDNSAYNYYFGVSSSGKTVNLPRSMDSRFENVHNDPALSVLVVRTGKAGKQKKLYGYQSLENNNPDSAIARWTWNTKKKQFDVDYFLPYGTGAWFESYVINGKPDPKQRYYKRLDLDGKGSGNVFRILKLRIGDIYKSDTDKIPNQAVMVGGAEHRRVDVYESGPDFSERGVWQKSGNNSYITSRYYDAGRKLFVRPWQEISRKFEAYLSGADKEIDRSGVLLRAPGYGRTRVAVINGSPIDLQYGLSANRYLWVQPGILDIESADRPGVKIYMLDDDWNPEFHVRDGYWNQELSAWIWLDESRSEKISRDHASKISNQLLELDYLSGDPVTEKSEAAYENQDEINPEVLDRAVRSALRELRAKLGADPQYAIDESVVSSLSIKIAKLPADKSYEDFLSGRMAANSELREEVASLVADSMIMRFWNSVENSPSDFPEHEMRAEEIRVFVLQNQLSTILLKPIMEYLLDTAEDNRTETGARLSDEEPDSDYNSTFWREYWDRFSNRNKDGTFEVYPSEFKTWIFEQIDSHINISSERPGPYHMIDIGSGKTLHLTKSIYDRYAPNYATEIHAFDIAADSDILRFRGERPIRYKEGRIDRKTDYDNAYFDLAITSVALSYMQDREAAVRETMRILNPDGKALYILHHPESKYVRSILASTEFLLENRSELPPEFQYQADTILRLQRQIFQSEPEVRQFFENLGLKAEVITLKDNENKSPLGYAAVVYSENDGKNDSGARLADYGDEESGSAEYPGVRTSFLPVSVPIRSILDKYFSTEALNPKIIKNPSVYSQIRVSHKIPESTQIVLKILPLWGAPWISEKLSSRRKKDYEPGARRTIYQVLVSETAGYLEDIFLELLDNAASGHGVEWDYGIPIELSSEIKDEHLIIRIRDGGSGLPESVIHETLGKSYGDPWLFDLEGLSTKQSLEPLVEHNNGIKAVVRYVQALGGKAEARTVVRKENNLIEYKRVFDPEASLEERTLPDGNTGTEWTLRIPIYNPEILHSQPASDETKDSGSADAARLAGDTLLPYRPVLPNELDEERIALASLYLRNTSYLGSSEDSSGYIRFNGNTVFLPDGQTKTLNVDPEQLIKIRMKIQPVQDGMNNSSVSDFESALEESFARFRQGLRVLSRIRDEGIQKFHLLSDVRGFSDAMEANLSLLYQLDRETRFKQFYTQIFIGGSDEVEALEKYRNEISRSENLDIEYAEFISRIQIVSLDQILIEYSHNAAPEKPRLIFAGQPERFAEYVGSSSGFKNLTDRGMISIVPVQKARNGELLDMLNQFVSGAILAQWSLLKENQKTKYTESVSNYFRQTFRISADVSQINDLAYASDKNISWYQKVSLPVLGRFVSQLFERFKIRLRSVDISA